MSISIKDAEQLGLSFIAGRDAKWHSPLAKRHGSLYETDHDPASPLLGNHTCEMKPVRKGSQCLYSQSLKTKNTCPSTDRWRKKSSLLQQNITQQYIGARYLYRKNMDESQMLCDKWKKTVTDDCALYNSTWVTVLWRKNCRDRGHVSSCQGPGLSRRDWHKGTQANFWRVLEMFYISWSWWWFHH